MPASMFGGTSSAWTHRDAIGKRDKADARPGGHRGRARAAPPSARAPAPSPRRAPAPMPPSAHRSRWIASGGQMREGRRPAAAAPRQVARPARGRATTGSITCVAARRQRRVQRLGPGPDLNSGAWPASRIAASARAMSSAPVPPRRWRRHPLPPPRPSRSVTGPSGRRPPAARSPPSRRTARRSGPDHARCPETPPSAAPAPRRPAPHRCRGTRYWRRSTPFGLERIRADRQIGEVRAPARPAARRCRPRRRSIRRLRDSSGAPPGQRRQHAGHHRLEDRRHPGHDMHIAEREARRARHRVVDQRRAVGNARHPQPRLVQLGPRSGRNAPASIARASSRTPIADAEGRGDGSRR